MLYRTERFKKYCLSDIDNFCHLSRASDNWFLLKRFFWTMILVRYFPLIWIGLDLILMSILNI